MSHINASLETTETVKEYGMSQTRTLETLANSGRSEMTVDVHWDPIHFFQTRYDAANLPTLESSITYCGSGDQVEAIGCADYLRRAWLFWGPTVLASIENAVGGILGEHAICK